MIEIPLSLPDFQCPVQFQDEKWVSRILWHPTLTLLNPAGISGIMCKCHLVFWQHMYYSWIFLLPHNSSFLARLETSLQAVRALLGILKRNWRPGVRFGRWVSHLNLKKLVRWGCVRSNYGLSNHWSSNHGLWIHFWTLFKTLVRCGCVRSKEPSLSRQSSRCSLATPDLLGSSSGRLSSGAFWQEKMQKGKIASQTFAK